MRSSDHYIKLRSGKRMRGRRDSMEVMMEVVRGAQETQRRRLGPQNPIEAYAPSRASDRSGVEESECVWPD
eukprot:6180885-Pleurochrysis_carterae.AAC.1